ncbi:apoptosis-associated speck-like protein containing a CARD isoform X2 [Vanacampus margaritifer]
MCSLKLEIVKSLENLSKNNWKKFRMALVDRRGDRRVGLSKVEDKDICDVVEVLVSTFTLNGTPAVTCELLESIDCFNEANELNRIAELFPNSSTGKNTAVAATAAGTAGAAGVTPHTKEEHFVDKHRLELTRRVREVYLILDFLLDNNVIQREIYDKISNKPGSMPSRMEKIYTALNSNSNINAKEIFFQSLKKYVPGLVDELEHSVVTSKQPSFDDAQEFEEHFVDKHKLELIERVCNIKKILDVLQKKEVIQNEIYEEIYHTQPNQEKMRKIYRLALKSGKTAKDIFYECLEKYEPHLVADLERSE